MRALSNLSDIEAALWRSSHALFGLSGLLQAVGRHNLDHVEAEHLAMLVEILARDQLAAVEAAVPRLYARAATAA